jgi:hypothetical protein
VRVDVDVPAGEGAAPALVLPLFWQARLAPLPARTQPLLLPAGVREEWTIVLYGADPAAVAAADLATPFGSFRQWAEEQAERPGAVVVRRSLAVPAQRIDVPAYAEFRSFAAAADAAVAVPLPVEARVVHLGGAG